MAFFVIRKAALRMALICALVRAAQIVKRAKQDLASKDFSAMSITDVFDLALQVSPRPGCLPLLAISLPPDPRPPTPTLPPAPLGPAAQEAAMVAKRRQEDSERKRDASNMPHITRKVISLMAKTLGSVK